jgi:tetratricopeptide (TPR) repeat protein
MRALIIIILLFLGSFKQALCKNAVPPDSIKIHDCYVTLPESVDAVTVSLPDSINSIEDLWSYTRTLKDTLQQIKSWYTGIHKMDLFPAYLGDAWFNLHRYDEALALYKQLLRCTSNEHGRSMEWECYLYYKTGQCYELKNQKDTAIDWYRKAIAKEFSSEPGKTKSYYQLALCAYRCLMNIRCDMN